MTEVRYVVMRDRMPSSPWYTEKTDAEAGCTIANNYRPRDSSPFYVLEIKYEKPKKKVTKYALYSGLGNHMLHTVYSAKELAQHYINSVAYADVKDSLQIIPIEVEE